MPTFADYDRLRAHPEPDYPEAWELRREAEQAARGFVNPARLDWYENITRQHGPDWCSAVLGYPYPGSLRMITTADAELLRLAHDRNLDPPLPAKVIAWRDEDAARRAERDREVAAARRAAVERSDAAERAAWPLLEKRPNLNARRGPDNHFVPRMDVRSPRRRHPAGRPLCETQTRHRPRTLGERTDEPVTCVGCLQFAPEIEPAALTEEG